MSSSVVASLGQPVPLPYAAFVENNVAVPSDLNVSLSPDLSFANYHNQQHQGGSRSSHYSRNSAAALAGSSTSVTLPEDYSNQERIFEDQRQSGSKLN